MKKILFISAIVASTFGAVNAQSATKVVTPARAAGPAVSTEKSNAATKAKENVAKLTSVCNLQGDQVGKVNTLFVDYYTKLEALKTDKALSKDEFAKKSAELKKQREAGLKSILTSAQMKSLKDAMAAKKD